MFLIEKIMEVCDKEVLWKQFFSSFSKLDSSIQTRRTFSESSATKNKPLSLHEGNHDGDGVWISDLN